MFQVIDIFLKQISELGNLMFYLFSIVLCLILHKFALFIDLMLSLIILMIVMFLFRYFYFKERPKKQSRKTFLERLDASSFPSAHAMRIFSLAFWFSLFFANILITIYISIIALIVIYSRIYLKKHYFGDVLWGVIFSFIINLLIWGLL